jgi:hypothetical protein
MWPRLPVLRNDTEREALETFVASHVNSSSSKKRAHDYGPAPVPGYESDGTSEEDQGGGSLSGERQEDGVECATTASVAIIGASSGDSSAAVEL